MSIKLQFVREGNPLSGGIAWFSAGQFSHVDTLLDDGRLLGARSNSIKGIPPGVQIRPAGYAKFSRRVVFEIPCNELQEASYHAFEYSQLGKPYDKDAIWGFVTNRNWHDEGWWICSELKMAALESADLIPILYLSANKITPVAAALVVSSIRGVTIKEYT
jgi:hypothetical protein